jgi:hypothetical protein
MIEKKLKNTPEKYSQEKTKHHKKKRKKKKKHRRTKGKLRAKIWTINTVVCSYSLGLSPPPSALAAIG